MDRRNLRLFGAGAAIAAATVLAGASPAWAAGAGVTDGGSSNINVDPGPPAAPLCLEATSAIITLSNTGTFNGGSSQVRTTATFRAADDFFFGPNGTFSDDLCTMPFAPRGSLTISDGASCSTSTTGATYRRVSNVYVIETTTSTCGVLVFTGNQNPCLPLPLDPCGADGEREFTGTYTQAP